MRFDDKAFTFESTENRCFGRKSNVNADHETVRFLQNAFDCRSKSFLRKFGYEVFEGITDDIVGRDAVVGSSIGISFGSEWHAEHERARLAARLACLASN